MKVKDFSFKVVNKTEKGNFEIKKNEESFMNSVLGKTEILRPTGLADKNEEAIYEGYIVKINDSIYSIKFEIGSFMLVRCSDKTDMYSEFSNCWNDDVYPLCQLYWESNSDENILYNCEIIGNIYENPELLDS